MSFALSWICTIPLLSQQYGAAAEEMAYYSLREGNQLGDCMVPIRDSDSDGWPDLLVGAPGTSYSGIDRGSAYILSSRDGTVLLRVDGKQREGGFGTCVAPVGDLNVDGRGDFIATEPGFDGLGFVNSGGFTVFSGSDGGVMLDVRGGISNYRSLGGSAAGGKDLDGDGVPDFVVCESSGTVQQPSLAYVYSGATLASSFTIPSSSGIRLCLVTSDLSGDGLADVVLVTYSEQLFAYSGSTGGLLYSWASREVGSAITEIEDCNYDGIPELLSGGYLGSILLSGATGAPLLIIPGDGSSGAGQALAGPGDLNHDGVPDLAIAAPYAYRTGGQDTGEVRLYSGADGSLIWLIESLDPDGKFGTSLAALGDLDGDGAGELAIGSPFADNRGYADAGKVAVWSYRTGLRARQQSLSAAAGGALEFLVNFGPAFADKPYQLLASAAGRGNFKLGVDIPLVFDNLTLHTLDRRYPPQIAPQGFAGRLNAWGIARAAAQFPAGALGPRVGTTLAFAAITYPSRSTLFPDAASQAVELQILP